MDIRRAMCFAGVLILAAITSASSGDAQRGASDLIVRGEGVCGTAGPVGRYTLSWVVINPESNGAITITSAAESGAYKGGGISLDPARVEGGASATATDGPVPGTLQGTVTLTVDYVVDSTGATGRSSGRLFLEGNCRTSDEKEPRPKNGPSRVDD